MTNLMDQQRYEDIKLQIKDTSFGFSFSSLFSVSKSGFQYSGEVDSILRYITGHGHTQSVIRDKFSIFERIKKHSSEVGSRTLLNNNNFTTQIWFLPFGQNMLIDKVSSCLKERMLLNHTLKQFEILIVNSKGDFKCRDIKHKISQTEKIAKEKGKSGLIILAGNQLTLGVTLPLVDVVFLFTEVTSSDKIYQMMYRCMTEADQKKYGFVVDMNISRVLNTVLDYNVHKETSSIENKIEYIIQNDLIHIDEDLFNNKENKSNLVERLIFIWKSNPINSLKSILQKIEQSTIVLDERDQRELNKFNLTSSCLKNTKVEIDNEAENQELQSGKNVVESKGERDDSKSETESDI